MLNLTKRQMKAIANFCLNAYGEGAAFFGNRIEASDGKVAIRVQRLNGIEEEQVNIPRIALIAAIVAMDKDDSALITADSIVVNHISIFFNPVEQMMFSDLSPVFRDYNEGVPSKFLMFLSPNQNRFQEAMLAFEAKDETHYGSKERNLYMCGDSELYHVEVAMIGIDPTEKKKEE